MVLEADVSVVVVVFVFFVAAAVTFAAAFSVDIMVDLDNVVSTCSDSEQMSLLFLLLFSPLVLVVISFEILDLTRRLS
jgi:hypothetical protein